MCAELKCTCLKECGVQIIETLEAFSNPTARASHSASPLTLHFWSLKPPRRQSVKLTEAVFFHPILSAFMGECLGISAASPSRTALGRRTVYSGCLSASAGLSWQIRAELPGQHRSALLSVASESLEFARFQAACCATRRRSVG